MSKTVEQLLAERAALDEQIEAAQMAERLQRNRANAERAIAVVGAFKEALGWLKDLDPEILVLNEAWLAIPQQAQPRETLIAKKFGLSETEASNAKEKGRKAIRGL